LDYDVHSLQVREERAIKRCLLERRGLEAILLISVLEEELLKGDYLIQTISNGARHVTRGCNCVDYALVHCHSFSQWWVEIVGSPRRTLRAGPSDVIYLCIARLTIVNRASCLRCRLARSTL
jgi:hypothetical protein